MRVVFLDTVGLLALWDESDQWHESASYAYELLTRSPAQLLTSSFVLLECGNAAARRPYRKDVVDLWRALTQSGDLIQPTAQQIDSAWVSYSANPVGSAGIVDLVSFAIMRDFGIHEAFTNDAHFRAAGFQPLMI